MMLSAMPMVAASPLDLLAREPISERSVHFAAARTPPLSSLCRGADPAAQPPSWRRETIAANAPPTAPSASADGTPIRAALRAVRKSRISQPRSRARSRRSASGLIATAVPTRASIGKSLKLSEYAVQRRRFSPSRMASDRTACALPVPCRMSPTSRPVNTPSTDSATVPSAPVSPSRLAIVSASSWGVEVHLRERAGARPDFVGDDLVVDLLADSHQLRGGAALDERQRLAPARGHVLAVLTPRELELGLRVYESAQIAVGEVLAGGQTAGEVHQRRAVHERVVDVEERCRGQIRRRGRRGGDGLDLEVGDGGRGTGLAGERLLSSLDVGCPAVGHGLTVVDVFAAKDVRDSSSRAAVSLLMCASP